MRTAGFALLGWLVPGGAYLMTRRYLQFAGFALLVTVTFAAGLWLHGAYRWPEAAELQGLDGFTSLYFQASALVRMLAGGPLLAAELLGRSPSFLQGRVNEFGTVLLSLAGIFNALAIGDALEGAKEAR